MIRRRAWLNPLVTLLLMTSPSSAAWTVTVTKIEPPKELATTIREGLDHQCLTAKNDDAIVAEFWLRSALPSGADADQVKNGLSLKEIPETTLLGIVRFPKTFTDYRKQEIPAGLYTLRLGFQPDIGDHKDTAPHREFAMLNPAAKDRDIDTMDAKDLLKLSRQTHASDHPAVMLLYPAKMPAAEPKIVDKGDGVIVLELQRNVTVTRGTAKIGIGIVVNGVSKSR